MSGWTQLKRHLQNGGLRESGFLIGLDFDGTLAPLVRRPHLARLPSETRRVLSRLAAQPYSRVAIVSGRSLSDVKSRISLRGIHYAGNHGLEIQGPGLRWSHPDAHLEADAMRQLARSLRREIRSLAGVQLEDKGLTLSVHYRRAPGAKSALGRLIARALKNHAGRLVLTPGKMVWEVRPRARWNKGHALLKIARRLGGGRRLIFVGDDRTDEDGFRVLGRRAVTVRVGPAAKTGARFHLRRRGRVEDLLELLCAIP